MADLVNVGVPDRVYVRFDHRSPQDDNALRIFKRAGARLDTDRRLWFVAKHQRDVAVTVVVQTGGRLDDDPASPDWIEAKGFGTLLRSGWVLVAAGKTGVKYRNPYSSKPDEPVTVTWGELSKAITSAPATVRESLVELREEAEKLYRPIIVVKLDFIDLVGNTYPHRAALARLGSTFDRNRKVWVIPAAKIEAARAILDTEPPKQLDDGRAATVKQLDAIDKMLEHLRSLDRDAADQMEEKRVKCGGSEMTIVDASNLINNIGGEIAEHE